jgi:hypothetical protein
LGGKSDKGAASAITEEQLNAAIARAQTAVRSFEISRGPTGTKRWDIAALHHQSSGGCVRLSLQTVIV